MLKCEFDNGTQKHDISLNLNCVEKVHFDNLKKIDQETQRALRCSLLPLHTHGPLQVPAIHCQVAS